jgi:hypothetical protein
MTLRAFGVINGFDTSSDQSIPRGRANAVIVYVDENGDQASPDSYIFGAVYDLKASDNLASIRAGLAVNFHASSNSQTPITWLDDRGLL